MLDWLGDQLAKPGLSVWLLVVVLIVVPVGIGVFFGLFAFKGMTPSVFRCRRCDRDFTRKPWRRFPARCSRCRARDWNR